MRKQIISSKVTFTESLLRNPGNYDVLLTEESRLGELVHLSDGWSYYPHGHDAVIERASLDYAKQVAEEHARGQL